MWVDRAGAILAGGADQYIVALNPDRVYGQGSIRGWP